MTKMKSDGSKSRHVQSILRSGAAVPQCAGIYGQIFNSVLSK